MGGGSKGGLARLREGAVYCLSPKPRRAPVSAVNWKRAMAACRGPGGILSEPNVPKLSRQRPDAESYRSLVDGVQGYAILMLDPDGYVISWNKGAEMIQGYTADEIIGAHFSCFYTAEAIERDLPRRELAQAAAVGRFEGEGRRLRKDGSVFWADVVITRMLDGQGQLTGFSAIVRDSTEQREREALLRQSEERFRLSISGV